MKKWIILLIIIIGLISIGVLGYQYTLSYASTKMVEKVQEEILTEDMIEQLKTDPAVKEIQEQLQDHEINQADLPFTTKEEGLKVVIGKFSVSELKDIAVKVQSGLTKDEQIALYESYKDRFTEEEWQALLLIGLEELEK